MDNGACNYRRFLDGDEHAFDEVIREYRMGLIFFINRYLHDVSASEDVAIDVFMDLLVHRHRYNFKTSLKTYLYMIGRCRALDHLKRRAVGLVDLSAADIMADHFSLEDAVIADEQKRTVNSALTKLPVDMRIAVHLVYFEGLSYREAATVMKKSAKQIDNLLYRAKTELRSMIGREGELLI